MKFTLRCQRSESVPIICHRWSWHWWCTWTCKYLSEFSKKFEMTLMVLSEAWGKMIHEKNQKQNISWHCPFNRGLSLYTTSRLIHVDRQCATKQSIALLWNINRAVGNNYLLNELLLYAIPSLDNQYSKEHPKIWLLSTFRPVVKVWQLLSNGMISVSTVLSCIRLRIHRYVAELHKTIYVDIN